MGVAITSVELATVRSALAQHDAPALAKVVDELGISLELEPFLAYLHRGDDQYAPVIGEALLKLVYSAMREPAGFAMSQWVDRTLLVVRAGDRLVLAMQPSKQSTPFPKTGWKIGRWYQDPARNRPTALAWAADPARATDALSIPIVREPAPLGAGDARGEALRAAVVADPEDTAARLVYADWLIEQGDIRGELVRVQCELRMPGMSHEQRAELRAREQELLRSFGDAIIAPIESFVERAAIRRGLVEAVTIRVVKLAKYGPELVAQHPIIVLRVLVNGPEEFARLATLAFLARIPRLEFESRKTPKIIYSRAQFRPSAIADSPIFARTKQLAFHYNDDPDAEWQAFFSSLQAPLLESLELEGSTLQLAGLEALAGTSRLPSLRRLALLFPRFAQERAPAEPLVTAMTMVAKRPGLEHFLFGSWHIGDAVIARCVTALLESPSLVSLGFVNCAIGSATIYSITRSPGAARLETLELRRNREVGVAGLTELLASKSLVRLREIYLEAEPESSAELEAITRVLVDAPEALELVRWPECKLSEAQQARVRERRELRTTYA